MGIAGGSLTESLLKKIERIYVSVTIPDLLAVTMAFFFADAFCMDVECIGNRDISFGG